MSERARDAGALWRSLRNLLEQNRVLAVAHTTTVDWSAIASITSISTIESTIATAGLLQSETFATTTTYDALNRVVTSTAPDNSVRTPTYNEANQLIAVDVNSERPESARVACSFAHVDRDSDLM